MKLELGGITVDVVQKDIKNVHRKRDTSCGDFGISENEQKPHQLLLDFLKDLERRPQNYDPEILAGDPELTAVYGQVRSPGEAWLGAAGYGTARSGKVRKRNDI